MKKFFLLGTLLTVGMGTATASPEAVLQNCNFAKQTGMRIRLIPVDNKMHFDMRNKGNVYPYWFNSQFQTVNIQNNDYAFRQAKINTKDFFRKFEKNKNSNALNPIRYYKTITENCQQIWLRIDETSPLVSRNFDLENYATKAEIPWEKISNKISIQINDTHLKLFAEIGQHFTILPYKTAEKFWGTNLQRTKKITLNNFEQVKLIDAEPFGNGFAYLDQRYGAIELLVQRESGEKLYIPWNSERLYLGNPLKMSGIKKEHYEAITKGQLIFGMNSDEVKLAWGEPEKIKLMQIQTKEQENLKNKFNKLTTKLPNKHVYQHWIYPKRLRPKTELIFNEKGVLLEENQIKNQYNNEIYIPVAKAKTFKTHC